MGSEVFLCGLQITILTPEVQPQKIVNCIMKVIAHCTLVWLAMYVQGMSAEIWEKQKGGGEEGPE